MQVLPLLLVFVFCTFIPKIEGVAPSTTSSTVKVKDFQLLGADLDIATYTFTFDQDLYLHKSNYCPAYNCSNDSVIFTDQNSCVCDFASQTTCGTGFQLNNTSASCSCDYIYPSPCDSNFYNWTSVTLTTADSRSFRSSLKSGETKHWRVFVNSTCQGLRIATNTIYGISSLYISNEEVATASNSQWKTTNSHEKEETYICPTDFHFIQGTYFIAVVAATDTVFDLIVEDLFVAQPSTPQPEKCLSANIPYPWLSGATCLYDNVPVTYDNHMTMIPPPTYIYNVTFSNGTCTPVFIALQEYLYGSVTGFTITFPRAGNVTQYSASDRESFVICPEDNELWTLIQIHPETYSIFSNYRLTVSSGYFSSHWSHIPLASISPAEANFDLLGTASVNTYPYPVDIVWGYNAVTGTFEPGASFEFECTDWRVNCKGMSFAVNDNPFFPIPPIVLNLPGVSDLFATVEGDYSIPVAAASSKTFSVVVVLSYQTSTAVYNIPASGVQDIAVEFHGKIGNFAGEPVNGNFTASTVIQPSCNNAKFQQRLDAIEDILDHLSEADSLVEINTLRYKLDSTAFQDDFAFCRSFVDDLTIGVTSQIFNITSFFCPYNSSSVEWFYDPCCNQAAVWIGTCFPKNLTGPIPQFEVQTEKVQQVCKNVGCSQSYLEDYSSAKAAFESGQCSVDLNADRLLKSSVQRQYLECKRQAFPFAEQTCLQDSDCTYYYDNTTYTCSLSTGTCLVPYRTMEEALVACLVEILDEAEEVYLDIKYDFTHSTAPELVQLWMAAISSPDCVTPLGSSPNLDDRRKVLTVPVDSDCAATYSCESYECEDSSCPYPDETCHYTCGMEKSFELSFESACEVDYVCNWDAELCGEETDLGECTDLCIDQPSQSHFCGYCDSYDDCVEFTEISTLSECESTSVCLLSNGTYFFNLTDSQCDALQRCDLPYCGRECAAVDSTYSSGICYSYEDNSTLCTGKGGQWLNNTGSFSANSEVCVYTAASEIACAAFSGASWESCGDLSLYECSVCSGSFCPQISQNLMKCNIVGKPCTDANTCTNSGTCSDSDYFLDMNSSPQRYGGCTMSRFPPADVTSFPYCIPGTIAVPAACMWDPSSVANTGACDFMETVIGFPQTWALPAEDEESCLAPKACQELFNGQERYSPKDEDNCSYEYTGAVWTNTYEWTAGRWIGGVKRSLSWTQRQMYTRHQWNSTINYLQLEQDFMSSSIQSVALGSKSAALCQYQRTLAPMEAVTCDCTNSGSSQCFAVDPVSSIAQTQVCSDSADTEFYAGLRLTYYNSTVDLGCFDVLISSMSIEAYASAKEEKLLANFIPFNHKAVPQHPVYNNHGAVVGTILTDGVTLTPLADSMLKQFELCIQLESVQKKSHSESEEYPTLDFGSANVKGEMVPLRLPAYQVKVAQNSVYDGKYLCAIISNLTQERSYFAIQRKTLYEGEQQQTLSATAEAFSYTLAVMFLLASFISSCQIAYYIFSYLFRSLPLVLEHFLIVFIWLFVFVRTVYFFLIAHGLDSQVADYILVALPTFFYFTAFSIIVVLWAVVASKRFSNDVAAFKRMINRTLVGVNVVLYAIFVALVLAFQYAGSRSESPCSGRQDAEDNSSELKQNISIAYGMIIAGISLIIGVLFVVFGIRIRSFISVSQSTEKIFIVTAICSVGFILHSVFIVVVSFLSTPNLYFSFFGLIITEWFPAIFIISWLFIQRTSATNSSSKKSDGKRASTPRTKSTTASRTSRTDFCESRTEDGQVELSQLDVSTQQDE